MAERAEAQSTMNDEVSDKPKVSKVEQARRDAVAKQRAERDSREEADEKKADAFVIDLEKLTEPYGVVRVSEDETYPLRQFDAFPFFTQKQLTEQWNRILAIELTEKITPQEAVEYEQLSRDVFETICDMPRKKRAALTTPQVVEVCGRFFAVQWRRGRVRTPHLAAIVRDQLTTEPSPSDSTPDGLAPEERSSG